MGPSLSASRSRMDDLAVRIALVAAVLVAALAIAWFQQRRSRRPGRPIENSGLPPGFHYFSSRACDTCVDARAMLQRRLGAGGYVEHAWEEEPSIFQRLDVDEVPALLVVAKDGSARLFAGRLHDALE